MEQGVQSIVMYSAYSTYFGLLSVEERGRLITAIFDYSFEGKACSDLSPAANMAFMFIKDQVDRDREKYEKVCDQRRKNGALGGRPPKSKEAENEKATEKKGKTDNKNSSFDTDDFFTAALKRGFAATGVDGSQFL